jgi:hypothetical protein
MPDAYRNEPLPLDLHHELLALLDGPHMSLKEELMIDPSFETGVRCLDKLIEERRAEEKLDALVHTIQELAALCRQCRREAIRRTRRE